MISHHVKEALKWVRYSQPFNWATTSMVRAVMRTAGMHSELVIKHLHRVGRVESLLPNGRTLRLWSRADDWISNQIYWRGWRGFEPESVKLFFTLATKAKVTVDVGAHIGFYTILAAHANPQGRVYAFEPMPSTYRRLQQNVSLNRLDNVECIQCALGASDGTAELFFNAGECPVASSLRPVFLQEIEGLVSTMVSVRTLGGLAKAKELGRIDLMKIDTETTEPAVLAGMGEILEKDKPVILCEVLKGGGTAEALQSLLRPLGYRFYHLGPHGPCEQPSVEGQSECLNYLFTTWAPAEIDERWTSRSE